MRSATIRRPTATPTPLPLPLGQKGDWQLIFQDEFEGAVLDTRQWVTCYWWDKQGCTIRTNRELEWYQPENVSVRDGVLRLRAQPGEVDATDGKTYHYTSGMISSGRQTDETSTPTKFSFTYGYAEIRARVPKGQGLWPAFWLLPDDHTSKPEIDVMEILGDQPHTVELRFHYRGPDDETVNVGESWSGPDFSAGWHTFAIDWQPDALVWYIDGVERQRYTDRSAVPAQPMYLILNLAVGGNWPGSPDASTPFPSDYLVDYVRVWVKQ
ncbi:MAG TPA: glycoside hydrolase family 16 protein [Anaerolineae bacterium]|nr:glycoside hydrolase family 16 protein [Anaerolineae bacterium]